MYILKYIGPFLRINTLKKENIENQLFYFCKESLKHIVLNSKCGITIPVKNLKIKKTSNFDNNTFKSISPLLCIYKKANAKLYEIDNDFCWNEDKFKKEINIYSNILMTLSLLEMVDYYKLFEGIDDKKHSLYDIYLNLCKKQLEFYTSNFRNLEGLFVDKKLSSDSLADNIIFEDKNKKFKFSDQALAMSAFYKFSCYENNKKKNNIYKTFSLDILNMFLNFKSELYGINSGELCKLCMALNIFYDYSKNEEAKLLLLDLNELLLERFESIDYEIEDEIEHLCMNYLNFYLFYKNSNIVKFKQSLKNIYHRLLNLYNEELGIIIKNINQKDITFYSTDLLLYLITLMMHSYIDEDSKDNRILADIYKHQIIDSGIILSWPESPNLNDRERYRNFSLNSNDLLNEENFRMPYISTPKDNLLAPVFAKKVTYNIKKQTFKNPKSSFNSDKNFTILFLTLYLFKFKNFSAVVQYSSKNR
ncbi:hypothetical protein [Clostridium acetireducens]|uniref:hypothetical protein n=1 Tax=Clostridium acetireducens TaxID=76489 RepID=UPI00311952D0